MAIAIADRAELYDRLAGIRHVLLLQRLVVWFLRLVSVGLAIDVVLLLSVRVLPITVPAPALWVPQLVLTLLGLVAVGIFGRPRDADVAAITDRELGLRERLTTALENQRRQSGSSMVKLQLEDSLRYLRQVEPWQAFPIHFPKRERRVAAVLALLVLGMLVAPNPMKETLQRRALVQKTVKQEAQKIQKAADDVRQDELADNTDEQQRLAQMLSDLAQVLDRKGLSPEEAVARIAQTDQKLAELRNPRGETAQDALERATAALAREPLTREVANNVQKGDYKKAAEGLQQLGQKGGELSSQERDRAAAALRAAGAAASKADSQLGSALQEAGDALDSEKNTQDMGRAFQRASSQLSQAGQAAKSQSRMQRAQNQLNQSRNAISQVGDQAQGRDASSRGQPGSPSDAAADQQRGQQGDNPGQEEARQPGEGGNSSQGERSQGDSAGGDGMGDRIFAEGYSMRQEGVPGQANENGPEMTGNDSSLSDPTRNESSVPYTQVYANYQQKATKAMESSYVPLNMKELVKDYFSSLAPTQK